MICKFYIVQLVEAIQKPPEIVYSAIVSPDSLFQFRKLYFDVLSERSAFKFLLPVSLPRWTKPFRQCPSGDESLAHSCVSRIAAGKENDWHKQELTREDSEAGTKISRIY